MKRLVVIAALLVGCGPIPATGPPPTSPDQQVGTVHVQRFAEWKTTCFWLEAEKWASDGGVSVAIDCISDKGGE